MQNNHLESIVLVLHVMRYVHVLGMAEADSEVQVFTNFYPSQQKHLIVAASSQQ
jgi:hypothetical protein